MLYASHKVDVESDEFQGWRRLKFEPVETVQHHELMIDALIPRLLAAVTSLKRSGQVPDGARIVPLYAADREAVLDLHTSHLGGDRDALRARLHGRTTDAFHPRYSRVLLVDDRICGCLLAHRTGRDVAAVDVDLDAPIDFDAGQFMAMSTPGVPGMRGYSMVNFARDTTRLEFVVKKKPGGGFSEWLFGGERAGAPLALFGPLGKATFYPNLAKNLLCIAGGSGIAGMMAIVDRACQESYFNQYKGHVFFGVRTARDAFYLDELAAFRARFDKNLSVTIALSDEDVPEALAARYPGLAFDRGFVHEVAKKHMAGNYGNIRAYLAGPPPAVDASIRFLLLEAKLTAENIRYDKFS